MDGALLINKGAGISSFGVIEALQKQLREKENIPRRQLPKLGHGGTLDPFATGLLPVLVGRAVKLARYFLGANKGYEGTIRFGESTAPGDPTAPVIETSDHLPGSISELQELAKRLTHQPYLQTPPMYSAKKRDGKPLYELARQGIEVDREPKLCHLFEFDVLSYEKPRARFRLTCSSGTYVRTLAQDYAKLLGSVALLESLHRYSTGSFSIGNAWSLEDIAKAVSEGKRWDDLPCWIPFDRLLDGYARADASREEAEAILCGRQGVLFNLVKRAERLEQIAGAREYLVIYHANALLAVACREGANWELERVFTGKHIEN